MILKTNNGKVVQIFKVNNSDNFCAMKTSLYLIKTDSAFVLYMTLR